MSVLTLHQVELQFAASLTRLYSNHAVIHCSVKHNTFFISFILMLHVLTDVHHHIITIVYYSDDIITPIRDRKSVV